MALPGGRDAETASAETRGRVSAEKTSSQKPSHAERCNGSLSLPAGTVGEGVALGAPEEGVAVDDTLAEVTDTGGVGNVLAPKDQLENKRGKRKNCDSEGGG